MSVAGPTFDYLPEISVSLEYDYANFASSGKLLFSVFADRVRTIRPNDIGGISVTFGRLVSYENTTGDLVRLRNHCNDLFIQTRCVGRILNGKEVVWQNPEIA